MGTPNSDDSTTTMDKLTDRQLLESGKDSTILASIMNEVIRPRLKNLTGFHQLREWRSDDEDSIQWDLAMNLKSRDYRTTQCVRLCKDAIEFRSGSDDFQIVLFLTRGGEFITAVRQKLIDRQTWQWQGTYAVSNFQTHFHLKDLLRSWEEFRKDLELPAINHHDRSFTMLVVWSLIAYLKVVEQTKQENLDEIRKANDLVDEIYPDCRT